MSAALMRIPSKTPAIIINTIQFAWHNNNFIMQNMYLKKPNLNLYANPSTVRSSSYYIFFKLPLSWKYSATNAASGSTTCAGDIKIHFWLSGTHFAFQTAS